MDRRITKGRMSLYLVFGLLGCLLMGGSDWLMIYGDTDYSGALAWLTAGVALIPPGRNTLAMVLAFPAVICYMIALFGLRHLLRERAAQRTYIGLTALGLTPWLCLHLFYTMILYLFGWLQSAGETELSLAACEALFSHFSWIVLVAEVLMVLPFLYLFFAFITDRTGFPRPMALNNPLIIYVILKLITGFLPDVPARLAFVNGLMSESMVIWFIILLIGIHSRQDRLF